MVGTQLLWNLRVLKNISIPEGISRIGSYWFSDSDIECITISASVKELGVEAFSRC